MNLLDALKQVTTSIKTWVDENRVAKVSGKGLSTNDYIAECKNKVANMVNGLVMLDGKLYLVQDRVPLKNTAITLPIGAKPDFDLIIDVLITEIVAV